MSPLLAALTIAALPTPADVPVIWTGGDSRIAKKHFAAVTDEWSWVKLWMQHRGMTAELAKLQNAVDKGWWKPGNDYYNEASVPQVDFKTWFVVGIFGAPAQIAGFDLDSHTEEGDTAVLRVIPRYYSIATDGKPESVARMQSRPYAFFLLRRGAKMVRIEQGVFERKGEKPTEFVKLADVPVPAP